MPGVGLAQPKAGTGHVSAAHRSTLLFTKIWIAFRDAFPYTCTRKAGKCKMMREKKQDISTLTAAALMAAVLCVLGPLSVPIGPVPIAMANFAVSLAAWLLGPRWGVLSVAAYLLLGAAGMPVFAGYAAGAAVLFGPTGGYLIGYLAQVLFGGWAVERSEGRPFWSGLGLAAGVAVSYAFGTAWFIVQMGCTLSYALAVCVAPFIPFDAAKAALASGLGSVLRRTLLRAGLLRRH